MATILENVPKNYTLNKITVIALENLKIELSKYFFSI
jgi:hypothetical protein